MPEIADYELRREFLGLRNLNAVTRLEVFNAATSDRYRALTTSDVQLAAHLWAQARQIGHVTAPPEALDGDMMIAVQALRLVPADLGLTGTIIATGNVRHFVGIAPAASWSDIIA